MGKAFEKQTKTNKDQEEKQADALKALQPKELKLKEWTEDSNYFIKGLAEIRKSTKPIDPDEDLTYTFKGNKVPISFNNSERPMHICRLYIMVRELWKI